MAWLVPVLLLVVLAVFGAVAFAIISSQQAGERAAQAASTATAEKQAANTKATRTAVARNRARASANATSTSEALDAIISANATSTAYANLLEVSAQSTATAQAEATEAASTATDPTARSAHIETVKLEHNLYNDEGVKGMEINVVFTADNLKDVELPVNVYFSWPDGTKILSLDGTYETADHQVAVRQNTTPQYDHTQYDYFKIFMPYNELEMDFKADTFDIQLQVVIYDDKLVELARSAYIPFTYTSPGPPEPTQVTAP
jgi:hypothetical protein